MSSRELVQIIFAMIVQAGGDFSIAAELFDDEYEGKALCVDYMPEKDIFVLTMEDYDDTEDVH